MRSGNPGTTSRSGIRRRFGPTRLSLRRPTSMERVGTKVRIGYNRTSGDGRSSSHVHSPRSPSSRRSCDRGPRMASCSPRDLDPTDSIGHRVPPNQRPRATTAIAGCRLTPNFRTPNFKPARGLSRDRASGVRGHRILRPRGQAISGGTSLSLVMEGSTVRQQITKTAAAHRSNPS